MSQRPRSYSRRSLKAGRSPPIVIPKKGLNESFTSFYAHQKRPQLLPPVPGVIQSSSHFAMSMQNLLKDSVAKNRAIPEQELIEPQIVTVRILSNHGDPTSVACSTIDLLAANKAAIPIHAAILEPGHRQDANLNKLFDRRLIKTMPEQVWEYEWPPQLPDTFLDIRMTVKSESKIESVRIWPCALAGDKGIKNFQIIIGGSVVHEGELERDFGVVVPLPTSIVDTTPELNIRLSEFRTPQIHEKVFSSDLFGEYALFSCVCVQFDIHGSYSSKKEFGLSAIRMFDVKGEQIDVLKDAVLLGERTGNYDFERVFSMDFNDEDWTGEYGEVHPRIIVKFPMKTTVAAIEIVNMKGEYLGGICAVKKMCIRFDGRLMWSGRLNARGSRDSDIWKNPSTFVFFLTEPEFKEKVRNHSQ